MIFKLSVFGLTLIVGLICFFPLLKNYRIKKTSERAEFNKAFYFDRLREIEQDIEKGILENSSELKTELQHRLLEDVPSEKTVEKSQPLNKFWFIAGFIFLLVVSCGIYIPVGSWQAQESLEQNSSRLTQLLDRLRNNQDEGLSEQEMQQVIIGLRLNLQQHSENAANWWLMGQLAMATNNGRLALDSYDKAYSLQPSNLKYALAYAKILMFSQEQADMEKGRNLLNLVLRQDHTNLEALSLLAFDNYQQGNYQMAITAWELMLRFLPQDDQRKMVIERSIENAKQRLEQSSNIKSVQSTTQSVDQK
ncbi:c-type cytochrome biogenesis protein CcmI [Mergibacter septicus]|uniref:c-type cytochrome biogenesis protein CcmI n=1 Tax=Mergibacter septicus TaxID=221402 RepID=UPI001178F1BA|nr:c-type cytochrome biogenesis protein CcmI [Mergibacter septicus]AWX13162.1 c-type cytochrome biogenesis protein CcmI [Mergibacter septicus]